MDDEEDVVVGDVEDWELLRPDQLPARPPSFIQQRCRRMFLVDLQGVKGHDQYVFQLPNGVCVVGLAPSHPLISEHRKRTGWRPFGTTHTPGGAGPSGASNGSSAETGASEQGVGSAAGAPAQGGAGSAGPGPGGQDASHKRPHEGGGQAAGPGPPSDSPERKRQALEGGSGQQPAAVSTAAAGGEGGAAEQQQQQQALPQGEEAQGKGKPRQQLPAEAIHFPLEALTAVSFDVGRHSSQHGGDRSKVKHSGKHRNQGVMLAPNSQLCRVDAEGGTSLMLWAGVNGKLLEVNPRLGGEGRLLFERPCREGYVAILFPSDAQTRQMREALMPVERYLELRGLREEDLL